MVPYMYAPAFFLDRCFFMASLRSFISISFGIYPSRNIRLDTEAEVPATKVIVYVPDDSV